MLKTADMIYHSTWRQFHHKRFIFSLSLSLSHFALPSLTKYSLLDQVMLLLGSADVHTFPLLTMHLSRSLHLDINMNWRGGVIMNRQERCGLGLVRESFFEQLTGHTNFDISLKTIVGLPYPIIKYSPTSRMFTSSPSVRVFFTNVNKQ